MQQVLQTLDEKRKKYAAYIKWGLIGFAALVVSPVIYLVFQSIVLAIGCWIAVTVFSAFAPVISMKLANWRIKAIKSEASSNPVETLWNNWNRDGVLLEQRRERVVGLDKSCRNFANMLDGFKKKFGANHGKLAEYEDRLKKMREIHAMRQSALERMTAAHNEKKQAIELAAGIWELAVASNQYGIGNDSMSAEERFLHDLKEKTALDAIESNWNQAGAEFDQMLAEETAAFRGSRTLGYQPEITLTATEVKEKVA